MGEEECKLVEEEARGLSLSRTERKLASGCHETCEGGEVSASIKAGRVLVVAAGPPWDEGGRTKQSSARRSSKKIGKLPVLGD
jgi:hypothetical protein